MISIIIIVKNDPRIEKLLSSIKLLDKPQKCEVIVVDASECSLDFIKHTFPSVQWLRYSNKHKKRTYSEQRNVGIKYAKGEYIVFIDADCIPEKEWLVHLLKPMFEENEKIVSGACRSLYQNYIHKEEQHGKYREECETMNIAIAKEVIDMTGLFDETLEGCEDSDFCIRAREKGFKIRFEKKAAIYHDWGGIKKNITRSFLGGKDRVLLYQKHKKHLTSLSINNLYTFYYILYMLFLPVALLYPLYIFIVFIPSVIKRRNPIKELFNISFALGFLKQSIQTVAITYRH